jgi:hypothetical protein
MALTKEQLIRNLFRQLAKRAEERFFGQVTIEFQDGYPLLTRTIQNRKLEHEREVDGVSAERLAAMLASET